MCRPGEGGESREKERCGRREVLEWERQIHCHEGGEMRVSCRRAASIQLYMIWEFIHRHHLEGIRGSSCKGIASVDKQ